jgi:hypothetical protein
MTCHLFTFDSYLSEVKHINMHNLHNYIVELLNETDRPGQDTVTLLEIAEHYSMPVVCDLFSKITKSYIGEKKDLSLYDPASGLGALLLQVLDENKSNISSGFGADVNECVFETSKELAEKLDLTKKITLGFQDSLVSPQFTEGDQLKKFDIVVSEPPLGLRRRSDENFFLKTKLSQNNPSDGVILFFDHILNSIDESGLGIVLGNPELCSSRKKSHKSFRDYLLGNDWLEAVISLPANFLPYTSVSPYVYVINKAKDEAKRGKVILINGSKEEYLSKDGFNKETIKKIICSLSEFDESEKLSKVITSEDYFSKRIDNIRPDWHIDNSEFYEEVQILGDEFSQMILDDLTVSSEFLTMDDSETSQAGNAVYIHKRRRYTVECDLTKFKPSEGYYQINLNPDLIKAKYVTYFFRTKLGDHLLNWRSSSSVMRGHKSLWDIGRCEICVPSLETQEKFIQLYERVDKISNVISDIKDNITSSLLSPDLFGKNFYDAIEKEAEKSPNRRVSQMIKKGESKAVEFKETYSMHTHGDKKGCRSKDVENSTLKNLVGLMNSEKGGSVLLGVSDEQEVLGINQELKKLCKNNKDNYLKHLHNGIRDRIGEQFFQHLEIEFHSFDGKLVVEIRCRPSNGECYLIADSKERFYLRTGPATDELSGRKLTSYVRDRFKIFDSHYQKRY